ncbi:unnamed protein product [Ostreobium quekettii]|uniref:Uncharacterized protein n=1 Tax=Ostreobium quekettii TaxID=121088 RepID=A0A8S1JHW8_9CHLO|nr:unnamed protein product [Ostreobium quekettii]
MQFNNQCLGLWPEPTCEDNVVLHVLPAQQRLSISAFCSDGCLLFGQRQWLCIHISGDEHIETGTMQMSTEDDPDGPIRIATRRDGARLPPRPKSKTPDLGWLGHSQAYVSRQCQPDASTSLPENSGADHNCEREGKWVDIVDGQVNLPETQLLHGGLLVWLVLSVGSGLRRSGCSDGASAMGTLFRQPSLVPMAKGVLRTAADQAQDKADPGDASLHLQLQVKYFSRCWRTHSVLLQLPVNDPMAVHLHSAPLSHQQALVQATLVSRMLVAATLSEVVLELTPGPEQRLRAWGLELPSKLYPGESLGVCFRVDLNLVNEVHGSIAGEDDSFQSQLRLAYTVDMFTNAMPVTLCCGSALLPHSKGADVTQLRPPKLPPKGQSKVPGGAQECRFTWPFSVESVLDGPGPRKEKVKGVLLPPPMVKMGVPVALTWVLERVEEEPVAKELIPYELQMVRLGPGTRHAGGVV